jgi:alanine racemase
MQIQNIYKLLVENKIRHLLFDSRQLMSATDTLFFAIKGKENNGHQFIDYLYDEGVRYFVIEEKINTNKYADAHFLLVNNSVEILQEIAKVHRHMFDVPVIGITGSNGKTIVKEWLYQILKEDKKIVRSPQSYNSQIGVPMSVWQMDNTHELGIFEAGISKAGEMREIAPVIQCDIGIFTSLGTAHDAGFKNKKEKAKEKSYLFYQAKKIIYRKDIQEVDACVKRMKGKGITWSFKEGADLFIQKIQERIDGENGVNIQGIYKKKNIAINIPFSDEVSCYNAIVCWLTLLELKIDNALIDKRMQQLEAVAMRLELKKGINQTRIINDTYNLDLTSLKSSLQFMESQAGDKKQTLIISDILQHQTSKEKLYTTIGIWLNENYLIDKIIGIGKDISLLDKILNKKIEKHFYKSTNDFLQHFSELNFRDEIILVKGARKFKFEQIVARLEQQAHRTVLEINFSALKSNLSVYKKIVNPSTKIMVMVKASAYGSGLIEVAQLMESEKVDYLTVAYIDEGVLLREAGIKTAVLVLNPEPAGFPSLVRHNLEPEIYSLLQLKQLINYLEINPSNKKINIHIKLDTGMKRLGFEEKDILALIMFLKNNKNKVHIQSIFSHLAGSDAAEHDDFSKQQIIRYQRMYKRITDALNIQPLKHILNSAGISRFPDYHFDMVRLGIGLYGVATANEMKHQLQTISSLKASVSQIKNLKPGESVGYNRGGKVFKPTKIATVSIGYADGLSRATGNGKFEVLIRGKKAKTIGVICMDMCMIDITLIPEARVGDEVVIFGENPTIQDLSKCMNTIPYEVLTGISDRVKRVYVLE